MVRLLIIQYVTANLKKYFYTISIFCFSSRWHTYNCLIPKTVTRIQEMSGSNPMTGLDICSVSYSTLIGGPTLINSQFKRIAETTLFFNISNSYSSNGETKSYKLNKVSSSYIDNSFGPLNFLLNFLTVYF